MIEAWHMWVIAGLLLWVFEIFLPSLFVLGVLGTSCLIVAPYAIIDESFKMQLLIFAIATAVMALGIRPLIMKHFYRREGNVKTNVDFLIGKSVLVTEDIDSVSETGRVKIEGELWRAVTSDESVVSVGQKVTILKVDGCKVIVKLTANN